MPIPLDPSQHYSMEADDYFRLSDLEAKTAVMETILRQAELLGGGRGRLLDVGAGRGELLRAAKERGWHAEGVETSSSFAEYAAHYAGVDIRREPLTQCGFAEEEFDVIILAATLEHLYDPDESVREIARILRPGGVTFVDVPNEQGLYFRLGSLYQRLRRRDWVINLSPTFPPYHVFGFGPRSLRAILSKHGLTPIRWRVYAGTSCAPVRSGLMGGFEQRAAKLVTVVSRLGSLGNFIETWATKR